MYLFFLLLRPHLCMQLCVELWSLQVWLCHQGLAKAAVKICGAGNRRKESHAR